MHANNFYIVDAREIAELQWTGFVADIKKVSNSALYKDSFGGYGEHLRLSFFLSLICTILLLILMTRRLLVALSIASRPVETRKTIYVSLLVFSVSLVPILFPSYEIFYLKQGTRMSGMPAWMKLFSLTVGWPTLIVILFELVVNPGRSHDLDARR